MYKPISVRYYVKDDIYYAIFVCSCCGKLFRVQYSDEQRKKLVKWFNNPDLKIQDVLPEALPEWREIWVSGMCIDCQKKIFGGEDYAR